MNKRSASVSASGHGWNAIGVYRPAQRRDLGNPLKHFACIARAATRRVAEIALLFERGDDALEFTERPILRRARRLERAQFIERRKNQRLEPFELLIDSSHGYPLMTVPCAYRFHPASYFWMKPAEVSDFIDTSTPSPPTGSPCA